MFTSQQLNSILSALPEPVFVLTRSGRYVSVMGGNDARYDHAGSSLAGQTLHTVFSPEKANWFLGEIKTALQLKTQHTIEYELAQTDLKSLPASLSLDSHWFEARIQPLNFQIDGEDVVLWSVSNITKRRQLEEQLAAMRETDQLTGLWSRQHFYKIAVMEHERALRYEHPIALLQFDIAHFKDTNDRYGSAVGDLVLTELSKLLVACIRRSDVAIRWGGDEFVVLMPMGTLETANQVAERIRLSVKNHVFPQGLHLNIRCGMGEWALKSESVDELLARVGREMQ